LPARERKKDELAAYGVAWVGLPGSGAPADWDRWSVEVAVEPGSALDGADMTVWEDRARIPMPELGRIEVERAARQVVFRTELPVSEPALVHPGLVPAAAVVSAWLGRACLHGAAVLAGGHVWSLLGERGDGKSTTAALLAERGHELFTDDVLVADGGRAFAGPPVVDLREDASARVGGDYLGRIGRRERWRKPLPRRTLEAPLGGFVELAWGDGPAAVESLELPARLDLLGRHATMPMAGDRLLALAALPGLRFTRSHDLAGAEAAIDVLAAAW
jgi:hypothetical protein